jgi:hypothetical protein
MNCCALEQTECREQDDDANHSNNDAIAREKGFHGDHSPSIFPE